MGELSRGELLQSLAGLIGANGTSNGCQTNAGLTSVCVSRAHMRSAQQQADDYA